MADSGEKGIDALRPSDAQIFLRVATGSLDFSSMSQNGLINLKETHSPTSWTFTTSDPEKAAVLIFNHCSEQAVPILELRPQAQRLEDVFRALTT
ncbi:MAG: hypothetical protein R3B47_12695 [Bacteroidia bacterium]